MRFARLLIGVLCLAGPGVLHDDPSGDGLADRVAHLVEKLGHHKYDEREAATKELDSIGEPALDALRKASGDADPEVRLRAERIARDIAGRDRAAATGKALAELNGAWNLVSYDASGRRVKDEDGSHRFLFDGDRWSIEIGGQRLQAGTVQRIEAKENLNTIDLLITEGGAGVETALSIYKVEGDTLKYLFSGEPRATEFATRPGDGRHYSIFRRARPGMARPRDAARPPEARFESAAFSTDLIVPESPTAVHRVALRCRPADGEAGTLTLDPTVPRFDAFGDPAEGGQPAPVVTLDCTLKLVQNQKDRQLYAISGPRAVTASPSWSSRT